MKATVIYMPKMNHTKQMAENIARGMEKADDVLWNDGLFIRMYRKPAYSFRTCCH